VAVALQDAARAGGGLDADSLRLYFVGDAAGLSRITATLALLASVVMAVRRAPRYASVFAILALAAVVVGGHARAAHAPALAMTSDVVHLAAASVWIGGIAHLVVAWVPRILTLSAARRREVLQIVLPRFGRLALGSFGLLAVAGTVTAATELPSVGALWADGYGRTLVVKGGLVVAIASLSYVHAFRLRPRVIASSAYGSPLERRHWRVLAAQTPLAAGVMIAAACLVVIGPPPTSGRSQRTSGRAIGGDSVSVAEQAGPYIVNAVISRQRSNVNVELYTFDALERRVEISVRVAGNPSERRCGPGCVRLNLSRPRTVLALSLTGRGRRYDASLPIGFVPGSARLAADLVSKVAKASRELRSVAIRETLGTGSGAVDVTNYQLRAPNEFAYRLVRAGRAISDTVIIGSREWIREAGARRWTAGNYGGGGAQFSTAAYLDWWTPYATRPRLLRRFWVGGHEQTDVATTAQVAGLGTVWLRLRIDVHRQRLLRIQMITVDHFMTQTWSVPRPNERQPTLAARSSQQ
jgi:putative copper export protein